MKKKIIIPIVIAIIIAIVAIIVIMNNSSKHSANLNTTKEIKTALKTIQKNLGGTLPDLEVTEINPKDSELVSSYTYLTDPSIITSLVVAEPTMSSQAYLALIFKVKDNVNVEEVKKELLENIDMNRWICVSADVLYITNNGNTIFAVMSFEDWATPVYNEFVKYVDNNVGKTLEKTADDIELPETNLPQVTE
jgi:hypothetical protein